MDNFKYWYTLKYTRLNEEVKKEDVISNLLSKYSDQDINNLVDILEFHRNQRQQIKIPVSIFSNPNLGILESTVKYLKENHSMAFAEIAKILNRDQRTIWTSYNSSTKKSKELFEDTIEPKNIPISIFFERTKSPLQSLVCYLHHHHFMRFKDIASIINRDYRTVWLSYNRVIKMRKG